MTWRDIPGWFDFEELYRGVAQEAHDGSVLVEVGVWLGRSIAFLAEELRNAGKHPTLLAVDTWAGSPAEAAMLSEVARCGGQETLFVQFLENMHNCGALGTVTPVRMDSLAFASRLQKGFVDFCFIDASHDYESVKADLAAWRPVMKPGGLLAGHDAGLESVSRAVREQFGDDFSIRGSCWACRC